MPTDRSRGSVDIGPYGPSGQTLQARINRSFATQLNHLIHLGHDIAGAYDVAIHRVSSPTLRRELCELEGDHGRQIRELAACVEELGEVPEEGGDLLGLVERWRVMLAERRGDAGIVRAMKRNERELFQAYLRVLAQPGLPRVVRETIARALEDECRHRRYFNDLDATHTLEN